MHTPFASLPAECARILALAEHDPGGAAQQAERELAAYLAERERGATPAAPTLASAWWDFTLGWALLRWERLGPAQAHLEAAEAALAAAGLRLPALRCAFGLRLVEFNREAPPTLEPDLLALAGELELLGARSDALRARVQLALLYDNQGRAGEAVALLEQLGPALGQVRPLDHAGWLVARGAAAISSDQLAEAEQLLAKAEPIFAGEHATIELARCWFQQAWLALRREQLEAAQELYLRAETVFRRLDLPIRCALVDRALGLLFSRTGQYDEALRRLMRALDTFTALGRPTMIGRCQLNLGNVYFYAGWWSIADAYYRRAEQLFALDGGGGLGLTARRNRGLVAQRSGKLAEALAIMEDVYEQAERLNEPGEAAEILANMAEVLGDMKRYDEAVGLYERARAAQLKLGLAFNAADGAIDQAWMMLKHGDDAGAAKLFAFAAPHVEHHPANYWRIQHGLACCAEARGDLDGALGHYQRASRTVADLRGTLAIELASSTIFSQAAQLHADSLRCAVSAGALEALLAFSELQRALVLQRAITAPALDSQLAYDADLAAQQARIIALQDDDELSDTAHAQAIDAALTRYGELLLQARHRTPASQHGPTLPEAGFDLARLRTQLNAAYARDWTVLVYIGSIGALRCVVLSPDQIVLAETPDDAELQRLINRATHPDTQPSIVRDFDYYRRRRASQPWEQLSQLSAQLIPPEVRARLHPNHRLLIVPAAQLHTLPWAALRLGDRWLAELAIVQLAPALTVWQALAARPVAAAARALLIGCHTFGARAAPLNAVRDELDVVARIWPGASDRLVDEQATCAAVRAISARGELARYDLLHIATHASLVPKQGMRAHIKLWDADLWLAEVSGLRLGNALVVLSACEGAGAELLPGDEALSLSWAWLAAGATGVLASLWKIGDAGAQRFMQEFYTALGPHGDAARALAETQRAAIARSSGTPGEPDEVWLWASFVLTGGDPADRPRA